MASLAFTSVVWKPIKPGSPTPVHRGIGGALLPRNRADRKDKEKEKRGKGQSTASHWKSEAEMVCCAGFWSLTVLLIRLCETLLTVLSGQRGSKHSRI